MGKNRMVMRQTTPQSNLRFASSPYTGEPLIGSFASQNSPINYNLPFKAIYIQKELPRKVTALMLIISAFCNGNVFFCQFGDTGIIFSGEQLFVDDVGTNTNAVHACL